VKEIAGKKVHQVLVGSCTNASYKDITTLARILKDRTISPACRSAWRRLPPGAPDGAKESSVATLVGAGARILETACGFCIGAGRRPRRAASPSARTTGTSRTVRNEGRRDLPRLRRDGAACALKERWRIRGRGGGAGIAYPEVKVPKNSTSTTRWSSPRGRRRGRGPARANIGKPPESAPCRRRSAARHAESGRQDHHDQSCPPGRG